MCGIAAIGLSQKGPVGAYLYKMLKSLNHRGQDSAGVAIYGINGAWRLKVITREVEEVINELRRFTNNIEVIKLNDGNIMIKAIIPRNVKIEELLKIIHEYELGVISFGRFSEVIKDVGLVDDVERKHKFSSLKGSHGIGHVRFSTESEVDALHAHPFITPEFPDVTIVHNGQITNYWKMREYLELKGHKFQTNNDSELIIHYIVHKLKSGFSLEVALKHAVEDLDGPFAFIVALPDALGMVRDRLGLRPLVYGETEDVFVAASEEVAIRALDMNVDVKYLKPGEVKVWRRKLSTQEN